MGDKSILIKAVLPLPTSSNPGHLKFPPPLKSPSRVCTLMWSEPARSSHPSRGLASQPCCTEDQAFNTQALGDISDPTCNKANTVECENLGNQAEGWLSSLYVSAALSRATLLVFSVPSYTLLPLHGGASPFAQFAHISSTSTLHQYTICNSNSLQYCVTNHCIFNSPSHSVAEFCA